MLGGFLQEGCLWCRLASFGCSGRGGQLSVTSVRSVCCRRAWGGSALGHGGHRDIDGHEGLVDNGPGHDD